LQNNGLATGRISLAHHQSGKTDTVIAQDPPAGAALVRQEPVHLLVSSGAYAHGHMMPDLEHLGLEKALSVLEGLGLSVGRIDTRHDPDRRPNIVVEQMPLHGYYVGPGQRVDLMVNRSGGQNPNSGQARAAKVLFRYRVPPGVLKQHIRLELSAFGTTFTIYDQLMKPGREIWTMVPAYTEAALFLYKNEELMQTEVYN
jgi:serine/threonine-protein kinase